jgi:hypothetical protein
VTLYAYAFRQERRRTLTFGRRGADGGEISYFFAKRRHFERQAKHVAELHGLAERAAELEAAALRFTQAGNDKLASNYAEQAAELRRAGY